MNYSAIDSSTVIGEAFFTAVSTLLEENPEGLSEHQLLRLLHSDWFAFLGDSPWQPHALFCAHFLLFHALYRLRDTAWQARRAHLDISPLRIRWLPYRAADGALATADALREYYLDLANLEGTSAQDVDALLASFWARLQRSDGRAEALQELGLCDPVDDAMIKRAYRQLVMQHHPDRGGDTQRLQAINAAVDLLLSSV
jgi:hypothetical protein